VPFILVMIMDGWRGIRETWPATLAVSIAFSATQATILLTLGPELNDIIPGLVGMAVIFTIGRVFTPAHIYREDGGEAPEAAEKKSLGDVVVAWSPFYILTAVIFVWSIPWFKGLFVLGGALEALVFRVPVPGITGQIETASGTAVVTTWDWTPLNATGTAILIAVLIMLILIVANIANSSGGSASIGNALAGVGAIFPLFAPIIGWLGVFITGSVVNNNTLFAQLQAVTADNIGVDPTLLVAANTVGGTMATVVSPQSIAIAAGAVGLTGREGEILRASIKYSLGMLAFICVWVFTLSLVLPS